MKILRAHRTWIKSCVKTAKIINNDHCVVKITKLHVQTFINTKKQKRERVKHRDSFFNNGRLDVYL